MEERKPFNAAYATGVGSAAAIPQLCRYLADRGLLRGAEIEVLRHSALSGFDQLRERRELSDSEKEALETTRGHLDAMWQRAALAAEGQDKQRG